VHAVLDDLQAVQPGSGQRDGFEEIGGEDGFSLGAQERHPSGRGPLRYRVDASLMQDGNLARPRSSGPGHWEIRQCCIAGTAGPGNQGLSTSDRWTVRR
jgi:hypothetical protein